MITKLKLVTAEYSYLPTPLIPYQQKCLWAREGGNVLLISTEHVCQETGKPDLQQQAANTAFNTAFHAGRPEGTTTLPEQIKPFLYNWE